MLGKIIVIVAVLIIIVSLVGGFMLITGKYKPFANEEGEPEELSQKEKFMVGAFILSIWAAFLSVALSSDHPKMIALKRKLKLMR